jgi:hypothetical protein
MKKYRIFHYISTLFVLMLVVYFCYGCVTGDSNNENKVSEAQSKEILNTIIMFASTKNVEKLCSFGASTTMTTRQLEDVGGWESLPSTPPTITNTYVINSIETKSSIVLGGRVLILDGIDGLGNNYQTEFLVAYDSATKRIIVPYPIYWSGIKIRNDEY